MAFLLVSPLIWLAGHAWLEGYANRVELGPEFYLVPTALLLIIALGTVSYRTLQAATANPVESLRDE